MTTVLNERETETNGSLPRSSVRSRKARSAALLAAGLMALGMGVSGCGGSSGGGSAGDATATTGTGGGSGSSDTTDPLVKYSACMRSNGVPSFPDPVNGRLQLQAQKGTDLDPSSSTFQAAQKACKSLEPSGLAKGQAPGGEQQNDMLKFVACMRKNGVTNFPDPQPDGRMLLDPSSGIDPNSSVFQSAQETCRKLLPGGVAPGQ
jgi:hypothetical protein